MVRDVYEDDGHIYLVEDQAMGGDLFDLIAHKLHLDENTVARVLHKLLSVVAFLHEKGVVHRDLKLENVFLRKLDDENSVVVGDFGNCFVSKGRGRGRGGKVLMDTVVGE